jgi:hypothetical protein
MSDYIPYKIINDLIVKKIPATKKETRPPKHYKISDLLYLTMALFGSTGCGKTTALFAVLKECLLPDTIVMLFCGTEWDDADYEYIKAYVEKHGKELRVYDSMLDEEEGNVIENLMKEDGEKRREENEKEYDEDDDQIKEELPKLNFFLFEEEVQKQKEVKKKQSKWAPVDYICIFDDLPENELRSKTLYHWCKQSRHHRAINIISTRALYDLFPKTRGQVKSFLCFDGLSEDNLKEIYKRLALKSIKFDTFYSMYTHVIQSAPYRFLYIDKSKREQNIKNSKTGKIEPNGKFRMCLNVSLLPQAFENTE